MNDIIKELMKHVGTDTSGKWMGIDHAEKFAELIVRECMDVVSKKCASPTAYQALMEHWSIEE
jgi:hypothetical protein